MAAGCAAATGETWDLTVLDWADMLAGGEDDAAYFAFDADATGSIRVAHPGHPAAGHLGDRLRRRPASRCGPRRPSHTQAHGRSPAPGPAAAIADRRPDRPRRHRCARDAARRPPGRRLVRRPSASRRASCGAARPAGLRPRPRRDARRRRRRPATAARIVDLTTAGVRDRAARTSTSPRRGKDTYSPARRLLGRRRAAHRLSPVPSERPARPSFVVRQRPTDAVGSVVPPSRLSIATGLYRQPNGPDIVGVAPDPLVPDAVWVANVKGTATASEADPDYDLRTAQARTADGATFAPIAPLRVLDTRDGTGLAGPFVSGTPRSFEVAGVGAIPDDAIAVTANVTVTGQTAAATSRSRRSRPRHPTSSTLNFPAGDTRANNVDGLARHGRQARRRVQVVRRPGRRTSSSTSPATSWPATARPRTSRSPGPPARHADRQRAAGRLPGERPAIRPIRRSWRHPARRRRHHRQPDRDRSDAAAGYVSVTPTPAATPSTSTINFPSGDARANGLTVPLSPTGPGRPRSSRRQRRPGAPHPRCHRLLRRRARADCASTRSSRAASSTRERRR